MGNAKYLGGKRQSWRGGCHDDTFPSHALLPTENPCIGCLRKVQPATVNTSSNGLGRLRVHIDLEANPAETPKLNSSNILAYYTACVLPPEANSMTMY